MVARLDCGCAAFGSLGLFGSDGLGSQSVRRVEKPARSHVAGMLCLARPPKVGEGFFFSRENGIISRLFDHRNTVTLLYDQKQ